MFSTMFNKNFFIILLIERLYWCTWSFVKFTPSKLTITKLFYFEFSGNFSIKCGVFLRWEDVFLDKSEIMWNLKKLLHCRMNLWSWKFVEMWFFTIMRFETATTFIRELCIVFKKLAVNFIFVNKYRKWTYPQDGASLHFDVRVRWTNVFQCDWSAERLR